MSVTPAGAGAARRGYIPRVSTPMRPSRVMRLLSFAVPSDPTPRVGLLAHDGARVVDLTAIGVSDMREALVRLGQLRRVAGHLLHNPGAVAHRLADVRVLAPVPDALPAIVPAAPGVALGAVREAGAPLTAVEATGPEATIVLPPSGSRLGVGLAAVASAGGAGVAAADAEAAVGGVTLLMAWARPDGSCLTATGPWVVTLDDLADRRAAPLQYDLEAAVAVDDALLRRGGWRSLSAALAPALARASAEHPLATGDVVGVATFELAAAATARAVVVECERLGALRAFPQPLVLPEIRRRP